MAFCALVCQFRRFSVEVPRTASPSQLALLVERWVQDTEARKVRHVMLSAIKRGSH